MGDHHPLKNILVTSWLGSPLAGEPPDLDGVLAWELANRLGMKHARKMGRWTPPEEIQDVPIPLAKMTVGKYDVYRCSAPILPEPLVPEWVDHMSKRFESSKLAMTIAPDERKTVLVASGPYKSRFAPVRVRLVDRVCWFVRGDREGINKLLKSVKAIGTHRNIGYGWVYKWTYEEVDMDMSVFAPCKGKKVLMRTVPLNVPLEGVCGYKRSYGGWRPPYWHPAFHAEVAVPC